ncbi:PmeII family type II restriction endonuclease [Pedobacter gandavensis]|uniref:PmeII family type II restriction endonuclease n=1 Tax=Pedobacter gandavensis TaxID=2679963 RepID=UPI002930C771|nr:PmeII family type II restriction endonuclease [Pedobacter gandavensis]
MIVLTEIELINKIVSYIKTDILENHISASIKTNSRLKAYKINPIVVKYLSKMLENGYTPLGVAKALYYPRVLSTSINTSFGTRIQKMFVKLELAKGSLLKGMDIEFFDLKDNVDRWCQLKSGPNTINSEDVEPLIKKFTEIINRARTNIAFSGISNSSFIVGVIYGETTELSLHYKEIDKIHPVFVGADFWHRLTGYENFYFGLVAALHTTIMNLNTENIIELGCLKLASEIEKSSLFEF